MMKGEYREEEDDEISHHHHNHNHNQNQNQNPIPTNSTPQNDSSTQTFPKFQNHPKFLSPPPPHFLPQHHYQPFRNTETTPTTKPTKKPKNTPTTATTTSSEETGTIELSRRPRGRPPGSKNKPKPAIVINRPSEQGMSPYILELPSGVDIINSLTRFTRNRGVGLCVLTATGAVLNVTLNQPFTDSTSNSIGTVIFHGRFDILSISACLTTNPVVFGGSSGGFGFTISLAGPHGQIVGGKVVGPLVCDGTVFVVATSFDNPNFCRLPLEDNYCDVTNNDRVAANTGGGDENNSPIAVGGGSGGGGGTGMGLYMSNPCSNVIWGNTSGANVRPHQPP